MQRRGVSLRLGRTAQIRNLEAAGQGETELSRVRVDIASPVKAPCNVCFSQIGLDRRRTLALRGLYQKAVYRAQAKGFPF